MTVYNEEDGTEGFILYLFNEIGLSGVGLGHEMTQLSRGICCEIEKTNINTVAQGGHKHFSMARKCQFL